MATKPQTKKNIKRKFEMITIDTTTRTARAFTWSPTKQIAQKNVIICIFRPHGALNQLSLFLMNSFLISTSFLHVLWFFLTPRRHHNTAQCSNAKVFIALSLLTDFWNYESKKRQKQCNYYHIGVSRYEQNMITGLLPISFIDTFRSIFLLLSINHNKIS